MVFRVEYTSKTIVEFGVSVKPDIIRRCPHRKLMSSTEAADLTSFHRVAFRIVERLGPRTGWELSYKAAATRNSPKMGSGPS